MSLRRLTVLVLGAAALCAPAWAVTVNHQSQTDFSGGITTGGVARLQQWNGNPPAGEVGVLPAPDPDHALIADELNYNTAADAQAAGWLLTTANPSEGPVAPNLPEFLFSGDTPTTPGATDPAAGFLRMHASRPQDLYDFAKAGQRSPLLAMNTTALSGDFVAETKINVTTPRVASEDRLWGMIVLPRSALIGNPATGVALNSATPYYLLALDQDLSLNQQYRPLPQGNVYAQTNTTFGGQTWYLRIVKRGVFFFCYARNSDTAPWVLENFAKVSSLAGTDSDPLMVGFFAKSWGTTITSVKTQYKDADWDYLHVNSVLPSSLTGTYSNVFDSGATTGKANWQTMNFDTFSIEGMKYQLRAGDTLDNGTLTDAGDFVGPDGTSSTYFTDELAQVIPNFGAKRYLEYRLYLSADLPPATATDDALNNLNDLPGVVKRVSATYNPGGLATSLASTAADYGADTAGVQVQPGGGDLGLTRTQVFNDDFTTDPATNGWSMTAYGSIPSISEFAAFNNSDQLVFGTPYPGSTFTAVNNVKNDGQTVTYAAGTDYTVDLATQTITRIPTGAIPAGALVVVNYTFKPGTSASITDRPGWLAFTADYPLDIWTGTGNKAAPRFLHPLKDQNGNDVDPNNFEIETEINAEQAQSQLYGLVLYQDQNNWVDMMLGRTNKANYLTGVSSEVILNDSNSGSGRGGSNGNDGSHLLQLRITKHGQIMTFSSRDMSSPSPSWRTQKIQNATGLATGGADFVPTQVGFMMKHANEADASPMTAYFHYFRISTLADMGTKDVSLPAIPAGSTPDVIVQATDQAGSVGAFTTKFQVKTVDGSFVGPDNTANTYFTNNEPKLTGIPVDLAAPVLRVYLDNTSAAGTPYVHALGIQYAAPGTKVIRDSNASDWILQNVRSQAGQGASALPAGAVDTTSAPGQMNVTAVASTGSIVYESRVFDFGGPVTTPFLIRNTGSTLQIYWRAADTLAALAAQPYVGPDAISQPPAYTFTGTSTTGTFYLGNTDRALADVTTGKRYFQYLVYFNQKTTATVANINDIALVAQALPVPNVIANATGTDIPGRFGASSLLATQTVPTGFGDNASEMDQLFARSDGTNLNVGITGNIEANGNGIVLLLDTTSGGADTLNYTGADTNAASGRLASLQGYKWDAGFTPDYALDCGNAGSPATLYIDQYDLNANTKTFLGGIPDGSTGGALTGGGSAALNNSNTAGVTDATAVGAPTATTGLELSVPLSQIGNPSGPIRILAVVVGGNYTSNQMLPGLPDGTTNLGNTPQDLTTYLGQQYTSLSTVATADDLPMTTQTWTYTPTFLGKGSSVDAHPPVTSTPTVFNGRAYVVEDVAQATGPDRGNVAAINLASAGPTATLDTTFGTDGRVDLDAPVTGRVVVAYAAGGPRLYAMSTDGTLTMMDATDGGHLYKIKPLGDLPATSSSTPAVIEDFSTSPSTAIVFVGVKDLSSGGQAYVARVRDNVTSAPTVIGTVAVGTDVTSSPSLVQDGSRVQIGAVNGTGGTVYTLNPDLTPVLGVATTNPVEAPTVVTFDSTKFFVGDTPATGDGNFYCFDASTGVQLWKTGANSVPGISGGVDQSAFVDYLVNPNVVFFGTNNGQLQARNIADGSNAVTGFPRNPGYLSAPVTGAPILLKPDASSTNGNLYVPTGNGLFIVNTGTPTARSRYPFSPGNNVFYGVTTPATPSRAAGSVMTTTGGNGNVYGVAVQ